MDLNNDYIFKNGIILISYNNIYYKCIIHLVFFLY